QYCTRADASMPPVVQERFSKIPSPPKSAASARSRYSLIKETKVRNRLRAVVPVVRRKPYKDPETESSYSRRQLQVPVIPVEIIPAPTLPRAKLAQTDVDCNRVW